MPFTIVTATPAVSHRIKFRVTGDGGTVIPNATLQAAIAGVDSPLRDFLTTVFATQGAAQAASVNTTQFDFDVAPSSVAGANIERWSAEIDIDKSGLPTMIVGNRDIGSGVAFISLVYNHTITR